MSTDEPQLRLELADQIQKYVSSPANDISKFIFSIINNTKLISLFIKINDIEYLYKRNDENNTPLMLAIKNNNTDIVKEIMLKIKYELCNFCRKKIEEEELKKPTNYVDVDLDLEEIMAKLSIKETPTYDLKKIINQLEIGGKWPDIDYLETIKRKVGFNEIKVKLTKNMESILNTCPEGKCPDIKKK
jgi:ankyrin repeat protein